MLPGLTSIPIEVVAIGGVVVALGTLVLWGVQEWAIRRELDGPPEQHPEDDRWRR